MNYLEISVQLKDDHLTGEVIIAFLSQMEFESFEEEGKIVKAYIKEEDFNPGQFNDLEKDIMALGKAEISIEKVPDKNWNEEWEKNYFQPIVIGDDVIVRGSFHKDYPQKKYEIIIDPKMAFGTGHHATTSMMLEYLLETDLKNKSVLDMGTGTGILAILCDKLQAKEILAVDNDPWAVENAGENFELNRAAGCSAISREDMENNDGKFNLILANINRNVLLQDISHYKPWLKEKGTLIVSGFLKEDLNIITKECLQNNLRFIDQKQKDGWTAARFISN